MKKRNLLAVLASITLLASCSSEVSAKPNYVDNELVNVLDSEGNVQDIYKNEFTDLYDALVDAGTSNSTIVDALVLKIAKKEIGVYGELSEEEKNLGYKSIDEVKFITKERFEELVDDYMVDLVINGAYSEDYLFQEDKFVREQRESLYVIKDQEGKEDGNKFNSDIELYPEITYEEIFSGDYTDYRKKVVHPIVYKRLLTAKFLLNKRYKTLGRSGARNIRYVKIDNSETKDKGSALRTLKNYIAGFLYAIKNPDKADVASYYPEVKDENGKYPFSEQTIANLWRGVWSEKDVNEEEAARLNAFIDGSKNISKESLYTLNDDITEEINKIADYDETTKHYTLKTGLDYENSTITDIVSKYTGDYSHSVDWGVTLKTRELNTKKMAESDFYVEKTGLTSLPSSIRSRLFSMSVSKNLVSLGGINFLLPEKQENSSFTFESGTTEEKIDATKFAKPSDYLTIASNLIHSDSSSSSYYVIIVDDYSYSTNDLATDKEGLTEEEKAERTRKATEIAIQLGEHSTYQNDTILHYFEENKLSYHDDTFYEYVKSTYKELFED